VGLAGPGVAGVGPAAAPGSRVACAARQEVAGGDWVTAAQANRTGSKRGSPRTPLRAPSAREIAGVGSAAAMAHGRSRASAVARLGAEQQRMDGRGASLEGEEGGGEVGARSAWPERWRVGTNSAREPPWPHRCGAKEKERPAIGASGGWERAQGDVVSAGARRSGCVPSSSSPWA
jgi:hypothetical protein